ncbi:MAG: class B sortase [Monoglobales bacterium]
MRWAKAMTAVILVAIITGLTVLLSGRVRCLVREQRDFEDLKIQMELADKSQTLPVIAGNMPDKKKQMLPKYEELYRENSDLVGWVSIERTHIDYPVMLNEADVEYYLYRDFRGNETFSGTPFVGYGSIEPQRSVLIVFGHNLKNGMMFHDLINYSKREYWKSHPTILYDTLYEHQEYEIFAAGYAVDQNLQQEGFQLLSISDGNTAAYHNYISELKKEALYDTGITPDGESLLLLMTCSYQTNDGRFFVAGKRK